jgi:hypothetical protein
MHFLAPLAAGASSIDLSVFAQYGVVGAVALALAWYAKGSIQRERDATQKERERADRLEAENKRLYQSVIDLAIPAMISATRAAEETGELLNAIQRERERERDPRRHTKGET